MTTYLFLPLVLTLCALVLLRAGGTQQSYVPCTADRALCSLRERLIKGELTPEEYRRLVALMR